MTSSRSLGESLKPPATDASCCVTPRGARSNSFLESLVMCAASLQQTRPTRCGCCLQTASLLSYACPPRWNQGTSLDLRFCTDGAQISVAMASCRHSATSFSPSFRQLNSRHVLIAADASAARSPSLFEDWLSPAPTRGFSPGIVATSVDPVLTSYCLPPSAPHASLGRLALDVASGLARLASSVAGRWSLGRAALSGLGLRWAENDDAVLDGDARETPQPHADFQVSFAQLWTPLTGEKTHSTDGATSIQADGEVAAFPQPVRPQPPSQDAELRHELTDRLRVVRRLASSPGGRAILAADEQGRVLLLDGSDLTILRLWKVGRITITPSRWLCCTARICAGLPRCLRRLASDPCTALPGRRCHLRTTTPAGGHLERCYAGETCQYQDAKHHASREWSRGASAAYDFHLGWERGWQMRHCRD